MTDAPHLLPKRVRAVLACALLPETRGLVRIVGGYRRRSDPSDAQIPTGFAYRADVQAAIKLGLMRSAEAHNTFAMTAEGQRWHDAQPALLKAKAAEQRRARNEARKAARANEKGKK